MNPTRRCVWMFGAGVPLALLPAWGAPDLWMLWATFLATAAAITVFDAVMLPPSNALEWSLVLPDQLAVGERGELVLRVTETYPMPRRSVRARLDLAGPEVEAVEGQVTLESALDDDGPGSGAGSGTGTLAAGTFVFPLCPTRRGRVRVQAVWLSFQSPRGLFRRTVRRATDESVPVTLNLTRASREGLRFLDLKAAQGGATAVRFIGDGTEFEALREYAAGFDPRTIDWRASARHRRLLAREFRAERNQAIVVAVDCGRMMAEPVDGVTRLDRAAHAALSLAVVAVKTGDRAGFYSFDDRPRLYAKPAAGMGAIRQIQRLSADLEYTAAETNFTLGLLELYQRLRRRSLIVLFTDVADYATAALLIENTARLARRHLVVFVTIRDPLLGGIRDRAPEEPGDVFRAVVSDELLSDRDRVLRELARVGVLCLDAPWQSLGAELLNRYFEIKRREQVG